MQSLKSELQKEPTVKQAREKSRAGGMRPIPPSRRQAQTPWVPLCGDKVDGQTCGMVEEAGTVAVIQGNAG